MGIYEKDRNVKSSGFETLDSRTEAPCLLSLSQPPYLPKVGIPQDTGGSRKGHSPPESTHLNCGGRRKAVEGT